MFRRFLIVFVLLLFFWVVNFSMSPSIFKEDYNILISDGGDFFLSGVNYNELIEKLNVEIVNENIIADRLVIEGYVSSIDNHIVLKGRKVNIQMSITDDNIVLGIPLISGSF